MSSYVSKEDYGSAQSRLDEIIEKSVLEGNVHSTHKKALDNLSLNFDAPRYELEHLDHPNSKFTPEEKVKAAMAVIVTGSTSKAAAFCNVEPRTISYWKSNAKWWPKAISIARTALGEKLDSALGEIIYLATDELRDRLEHGDEVLDAKTGETHRVKVKARDLAAILNTTFDKRAAIRGEGLSENSNSSKNTDVNEQLVEIQEALGSLGESMKEKNAKLVPTEYMGENR